MPTVRRKRFDRGRRDSLAENQRQYLESGSCFWDEPAFESENEARAAWERHRDEIMTNYTMGAGRRPWGFWRFDKGLEVVGARRDFAWDQIGAESESSAVHLDIATSHAERLEIEAAWMRAIELSWQRGDQWYACSFCGCPESFYEAHVAAIRKRQDAGMRGQGDA